LTLLRGGTEWNIFTTGGKRGRTLSSVHKEGQDPGLQEAGFGEKGKLVTKKKKGGDACSNRYIIQKKKGSILQSLKRQRRVKRGLSANVKKQTPTRRGGTPYDLAERRRMKGKVKRDLLEGLLNTEKNPGVCCPQEKGLFHLRDSGGKKK